MPLSLKYRKPDNMLGWDGKVTPKTEDRGQTPPHTHTLWAERGVEVMWAGISGRSH